MPEVRGDFLGFVEPLVDADVVIDLPAPLPDAGECMMIRVRHH